MGWYPMEWFGQGGGGSGSGSGSGWGGDLADRVAVLEHLVRWDRLLAGTASSLGARVETKHIVENPTYRTANVSLAGGGSQVIRYLGTA